MLKKGIENRFPAIRTRILRKSSNRKWCYNSYLWILHLPRTISPSHMRHQVKCSCYWNVYSDTRRITRSTYAHSSRHSMYVKTICSTFAPWSSLLKMWQIWAKDTTRLASDLVVTSKRHWNAIFSTYLKQGFAVSSRSPTEPQFYVQKTLSI